MKRSKLSIALSAVLGLTLPALSLAAEDVTTDSAGTSATSTGVTSATETELETQTRQMDGLAASQGQKTVTRKIAADFAEFSGSQENAEALAAGLRNGAEITLTGAGGTTASFTPATGHMGNGNVYNSLALAKQQLASIGITDPTPEQIQAALNGGTVTGTDGASYELQGILQLRSEGMGWGQIAKSQGTSLGKVVSAMRSANAFLKNPKAQEVASETAVTTVESATSKTARQAKTGESRVVNAAGLPARGAQAGGAQTTGKEAGKTKVTSAGSAGKSHTEARTRNSIVTASGAPAGGMAVKSQSSSRTAAAAQAGSGNAKGGGQGHFK